MYQELIAHILAAAKTLTICFATKFSAKYVSNILNVSRTRVLCFVLAHPGSSRATAGPGETFSRGPQTFLRGTSREKIFKFFFVQNGAF